jgi:hypothetical protein
MADSSTVESTATNQHFNHDVIKSILNYKNACCRTFQNVYLLVTYLKT